MTGHFQWKEKNRWKKWEKKTVDLEDRDDPPHDVVTGAQSQGHRRRTVLMGKAEENIFLSPRA